ncbi:hypothetical protein FHS35_005126 [Streptomyces umbrinus]|uniref:DUF4231 domain-containing protein n=1 Tax=Streptomyces umbrinus TaxID=67370 RepID=UPI00167C7445|nr:DUF4231 domain-containing protein [Streptomyces umbrinus]MCR3728251.1 hypothetical protein [Streptomyces umbrinus]
MNRLGGDTAVVGLWDEQSVWSQAANRLKTAIARARALALALGMLAAVFGTTASQTMGGNKTIGQTFAFAAALAAGTVPLLARQTGPAAVRNWTRLRSMSEAVKSEVYVVLTGVAPYRGADAESVLRERVDQLKTEASDLLPFVTGLSPVSRPLPAVADVDSYVEVRLKGQIADYYRPKSLEVGLRLARVRRAELALGGAGAILGAVAGAFGVSQAAAWVAVAAMVGASVSAHSTTSKYAYQQVEFIRTADELERLVVRRSVRTVHTTESDDAFVRRCEEVISVLNESWMVKWSTE